MPISDETDVKNKINEIQSAFKAMESNLADLRTEGNTNWELVFGDHWESLSATERNDKFSEKGRLEVALPLLYPKVQSLLGFQKSLREQFEAIPSGNEDELQAQLINVYFRHIENSNEPKRYQYSESDAFCDGIHESYGAIEIYKEENKEGNEEVRMRYLPAEEVYFDLNFQDMEHESCGRIQHVYIKYIDELEALYPDKSEQLATADKYVDNKQGFSDAFENRPKLQVIRDWKKELKIKYELHAIDESEVYLFDSEQEAKNKIPELKNKKRQEKILEYLKSLAESQQQGTEQSQISSSPLISSQIPPNLRSNSDTGEEEYIIKRVYKLLVEYTVIAGNIICEEPEILDCDFHPVTLLIPLFVKTKNKGRQPKAVLTVIKNVQMFADRLWSQMDYNIGADSKAGAEANVDLLALEYQSADAAKKAYFEGGVVWKHGSNKVFDPFQHTVTNPAYFQVMGILTDMAEAVFGGKTFQGQANNANQTGKAIERLQSAAKVMSLNILDSLKRFKEQLGKKLLYFIKNTYTYKTSIRIQGDDLTQQAKQLLAQNNLYKESMTRNGIGWVTVNETEEDKNKLYEASVDIVIESVSVRQDEKDIEFQKLMMLKEAGFEVPPDCFFDNMEIKATSKQKIIDAYNQNKQKAEMQMMLQFKQAGVNLDFDIQRAFREKTMGMRNLAVIEEKKREHDRKDFEASGKNLKLLSEINNQNKEENENSNSEEPLPGDEEQYEPIPQTGFESPEI